jgi:antitoxin component YwqK of YwqJK toxin-antitoxin module
MNKVIFIFISITIGIYFTACDNNSIIKSAVVKEVVGNYPDGSSQIERDFKVVDEKKIVVYEREYYKDGKVLKEGPLNSDVKRNGLWKSYYRDGILWSEGDFVNGIREGKTATYFANGQKYYEGNIQKLKNPEFGNFGMNKVILLMK